MIVYLSLLFLIGILVGSLYGILYTIYLYEED
jgi:hypothetical protein